MVVRWPCNYVGTHHTLYTESKFPPNISTNLQNWSVSSLNWKGLKLQCIMAESSNKHRTCDAMEEFLMYNPPNQSKPSTKFLLWFCTVGPVNHDVLKYFSMHKKHGTSMTHSNSPSTKQTDWLSSIAVWEPGFFVCVSMM